MESIIPKPGAEGPSAPTPPDTAPATTAVATIPTGPCASAAPAVMPSSAPVAWDASARAW
jgi:hypothetical protein